jgi:DNA-binding MarR family transcriptional regulator
MNKALLVELLSALEDFGGGKTATLRDFATWLVQQQLPQPMATAKGDLAVNREIAYLLQRVGRLGKVYGRKAFKGLPLASVEDFTLLNTVYHNPGISKKDLYLEAVVELTNGTQIVRRLVADKLTMEYPSQIDKRVTLLKLTPKGEEVRHKAFAALGPEVTFKVACLTEPERQQLAALLQKMNAFHTRIFKAEKDLDVKRLTQKYLK